MREPVVLPSGETYEKSSILRAGLKDPQTREQLELSQLLSNRALRRQIDKYLTTSVETYVAEKIVGVDDTAAWVAIGDLVASLGDDVAEPAL
jgi:hypothetical protein